MVRRKSARAARRVLGRLAARKRSQQFAVIIAVDGERFEVVLGKKLLEKIGGDDQGVGNGDTHAGKTLCDVVLVQQVADKGEAASLASERADAEAQKKSLRGSETFGLKVADKNLLLLAAIVANGLQAVARRASASWKSITRRGAAFRPMRVRCGR
jgi:hypothetical protein